VNELAPRKRGFSVYDEEEKKLNHRGRRGHREEIRLFK
jgi:hypothetical protein